MIKRFISALLGSLAAIWISVILLFILSILFIAAIFSNVFASQTAAFKFKDKSILYIELAGSFSERPVESDFASELTGQAVSTMALNNVIASITSAADNDKIKGIYIDCKGCSGGLAQLAEIHEALKEFKKSGKWIIAYGDTYSQGDYYIASIADEVILNPVGTVDVHGLSATTFFYKGLLDKLGVEMQIIKVGTFKSAVEPFILTSASEPSRLQQQEFLDNMWQTVGTSIAEGRNLTFESLNQLADSMLMTYEAPEYISIGLVDTLMYRNAVEKYLKKKSDIDEDKKLRFITPDRYVLAADIPHTERCDNRIAVLLAEGDIVDDGNGGIVASTLVPEILKLKDDEDIAGLILRVNSGGGSAFASEQIWEALEQFKETGRPFYVSMSDYAASGGYYISSGADVIFAEPVTLTGSIGVFGMIPSIKGLLNDKLGVTTDNVSTNTNGNFPTIASPMTPFQMASMQKNVNHTYALFLERCSMGRGIPVDSLKLIAEGRVWDGQKALKLGLVDRLGSLSDAVKAMAEELEFGNDYCVIEYPNSDIDFWNIISELEENAKVKALKSELGDSYELYKRITTIKQTSGIQCRMEEIKIQ